MRKILLITGIASVLIIAFLLFYQYRKQTAPVTRSIQAVPVNAAAIISFQNFNDLWSKVRETNLVWQALLETEYVGNLNQNLVTIDSLIQSDEVLAELMSKQEVLVSAHQEPSGDLRYLFLLNLPQNVNESSITSFLRDKNLDAGLSNRDYKGVKVHSVNSKTGKFNFFLHNQLFVGSFSASLAEQSVDQLLSGNSLANDSAFAEIYSTSGRFVDGNVLINYRFFDPATGRYLSDEGKGISGVDGKSGGWSALDLTLKPDAILLNGFTGFISDTGFVKRFDSQKPQSIQFTSVTPANAISFAWLGFSHTLSWLERSAKPQIASQFSWVEHEAAAVATLSGNKVRHYNIFSARNPAGVLDGNWYLEAQPGQTDTFSFNYRDFRVKKLMIDSTDLQTAFGPWFGKVHKPLTFTVGPYVVMAEDSVSAFAFIDQYISEKTLGNDDNYPHFAENLNQESNIYVYSAIGKSLEVYPSFASDTTNKLMESGRELLSKFEAAGIQLSSENNFFYTTAFLRYNPVTKQSRTTMWEVALNAPATGKPWIVVNHNDNTKEVFVQDTTGVVYLIDNKGNKLWERDVYSSIISDVHQVDGFKNGKLQLLFNTADSLYLIDRNGENVNEFPVAVPGGATAALAVFDYDRNLDYRIIVPSGERKVLNYDIKGNQVEGWMSPETEAEVENKIVHTSINSRDYIVALDKGGNVYGFDRRGDKRWIPKVRLPENAKGLYPDKGKDLPNSWIVTTDSIGRIHRLSFSEVPEVLQTGKYSGKYKFESFDVEGDGVRDYIYTDTSGLSVFGPAGNEKMKLKFPASVFTAPQYFIFPDGLGRVGYTNKEKGEVYLGRVNGELIDGFPLKGYSAFSIADLNRDGVLELVTSGPDKTVYVYNIKQ